MKSESENAWLITFLLESDISTTLGLQLIAYENITAMLTLEDIHMEQGDFEQAAAPYRHIVELQPNTTAKYNLGSLYD